MNIFSTSGTVHILIDKALSFGKKNAAMSRLVVRSEGFGEQVIQLRLGLNRLGRNLHNDFPIQHPSISAWHCEIILAEEGVLVRDCGSTNGTFVNGEQISEAMLQAGQTLALGDVDLFVESTEIKIAIPKIEAVRAAPPVVLTDGSLLCPRHQKVKVTHQCTFCREVMCDACVHRLRRRGGKLLKLCPLCSHVVETLGGEPKKKKSILGFLHKTVKLPFLHGAAKHSSHEE